MVALEPSNAPLPANLEAVKCIADDADVQDWEAVLQTLTSEVINECKTVRNQIRNLEETENDVTDSEDDEEFYKNYQVTERENQKDKNAGPVFATGIFKEFDTQIELQLSKCEDSFLSALTTRHTDSVKQAKANLEHCETTLKTELSTLMDEFSSKFPSLKTRVSHFKIRTDQYSGTITNAKALYESLTGYTDQILVTPKLASAFNSEHLFGLYSGSLLRDKVVGGMNIVSLFERGLLDLEKRITFAETFNSTRVFRGGKNIGGGYPSCAESQKYMMTLRLRNIEMIRQALAVRVETLQSREVNIKTFQQLILTETKFVFDYLKLFHLQSAKVLCNKYAAETGKIYGEKFKQYLSDLNLFYSSSIISRDKLTIALRDLGLSPQPAAVMGSLSLSITHLSDSELSDFWKAQELNKRLETLGASMNQPPTCHHSKLTDASDNSPQSSQTDSSSSSLSGSNDNGVTMLPQGWMESMTRVVPNLGQNRIVRSDLPAEEVWRSTYKLIVDTASSEGQFISSYFHALSPDWSAFADTAQQSSGTEHGPKINDQQFRPINRGSASSISDIQVFSSVFSPLLDILEHELSEVLSFCVDIPLLIALQKILASFLSVVKQQATASGILKMQILHAAKRCVDAIFSTINMLCRLLSNTSDTQIKQLQTTRAILTIRLMAETCAMVVTHLPPLEIEGLSSDKLRKLITASLSAVERWIDLACSSSATETCMRICLTYEVMKAFNLNIKDEDQVTKSAWGQCYAGSVQRASTAFSAAAKSFAKSIVSSQLTDVLAFCSDPKTDPEKAVAYLTQANAITSKLNSSWKNDLAALNQEVQVNLKGSDSCDEVVRTAFNVYMLNFSRYQFIVSELATLAAEMDSTVKPVALVGSERILTEIRRFYP